MAALIWCCSMTPYPVFIRKSALLNDDMYVREDADDARFDDYFGSTQSIVTSSAQNDSGLFETNLHDERYLPFEYAGAISEWQLALPANPAQGDPCQFDYGSISDVIMHLRYTAREGGAQIKSAAMSNVKDLFTQAQAYGSRRLFSMRQEFPTEWAKAGAAAGTPLPLGFNLRAEHYPLWATGRLDGVKSVQVLAMRSNGGTADLAVTLARTGTAAALSTGNLSKDDKYGKVISKKTTLPEDAVVSPLGDFSLTLGSKGLEDVWLIMEWQDTAG